MHFAFENITADPITFYHIDATVMRLDKIHPVISGNKWFKLQYYFEEAREQNKKRIESLLWREPGPTHIVATAAACHQNGFSSAGIIRGEEPAILPSTLLSCKAIWYAAILYNPG